MADLNPLPPDFQPGGRYVSAGALNQMIKASIRQIKGDGTTLLTKYFGNRLSLSAPNQQTYPTPLALSDSYNFTIATGLAQPMTSDAITMVVDQSQQYLNFPNDNGFLIAVNPDGSPLMGDDEDYELLMVTAGAGTANWTVIRGINGVQLPLTAGFTLTYFLPNATNFCTALTFLDGILTFDEIQQSMNYRSPAAAIILTSTTLTNGYMAGNLASYNPTTRIWSAKEAIALLADVNTGYVVNQHYGGIFLGYDQGKKVYLLENFGGGSGLSGTFTVVNAASCSGGSGGGGGSAPVPSDVLGISWVPTPQATTSATYTDLTTPDSVTFTLAQTTNVEIQYFANLSCSTTQPAQDVIVIDGSTISATANQVTPALGVNETQYLGYKTSLAAGSHTVSVQHKLPAGSNSVTWQNRMLTITDLDSTSISTGGGGGSLNVTTQQWTFENGLLQSVT